MPKIKFPKDYFERYHKKDYWLGAKGCFTAESYGVACRIEVLPFLFPTQVACLYV
jgi:hypothetical protein